METERLKQILQISTIYNNKSEKYYEQALEAKAAELPIKAYRLAKIALRYTHMGKRIIKPAFKTLNDNEI